MFTHMQLAEPVYLTGIFIGTWIGTWATYYENSLPSAMVTTYISLGRVEPHVLSQKPTMSSFALPLVPYEFFLFYIINKNQSCSLCSHRCSEFKKAPATPCLGDRILQHIHLHQCIYVLPWWAQVGHECWASALRTLLLLRLCQLPVPALKIC